MCPRAPSRLFTCITCCIAGLPYISSVVFLPILVFLRAYALFFLQQMGGGWNLFGEQPAPTPAPTPAPPPAPARGPEPLVETLPGTPPSGSEPVPAVWQPTPPPRAADVGPSGTLPAAPAEEPPKPIDP